MKRIKYFVITSLLVGIAVSCNLPFTIQSSDNKIATLAMQTVQAFETQYAPTATPLLPTATATLLPTLTPVATATPKALPSPTPLPCNQAAFISETIPDGTKINASQYFH